VLIELILLSRWSHTFVNQFAWIKLKSRLSQRESAKTLFYILYILKLLTFIQRSFDVHSIFIWCSFNAYSMFIRCSFNVYSMFIWRSFDVHLTFIWCSFDIHLTFVWRLFDFHLTFIRLSFDVYSTFIRSYFLSVLTNWRKYIHDFIFLSGPTWLLLDCIIIVIICLSLSAWCGFA
jgi:hypothetical protein